MGDFQEIRSCILVAILLEFALFDQKNGLPLSLVLIVVIYMALGTDLPKFATYDNPSLCIVLVLFSALWLNVCKGVN